MTETRWIKLLNPKVVRTLVRRQQETGEDVFLDIGPVELKVTSHQALYFIEPFLAPAFESLDVSFCVRP